MLYVIYHYDVCFVSLPLLRVKCGKLEYYDKMYDRITTKSEKKLARVNRLFHKVTTTDDPIIRKVRVWF